MDKWKYYDVRHKRHLLCNPISDVKFEKLCILLNLGRDAHVLDMACGKGEFLVRLAELYGISGVGVDLSSYCIRDCLEKHRSRAPGADIKFIEMDGAEYKPEPDELFDLTMCIGATWIYGGYCGTIRALKEMTKPCGMIAVGEPFWIEEPSQEYLEAAETKKELYGTHYGNVKMGEEEGLRCIYTLVSNLDDWDYYETLGWWAMEDYAVNNSDDEDVPEMLERCRREKEIYLRWERKAFGWAIYLFRTHELGQ